jgi:hypothetical protein
MPPVPDLHQALSNGLCEIRDLGIHLSYQIGQVSLQGRMVGDDDAPTVTARRPASLGLLTDDDIELLQRSSTHDAHRYRDPGPVAAQERLQRVVMGHRLAVQGDDGVAQEQATRLGGAAGLYLYQQQSGFLV